MEPTLATPIANGRTAEIYAWQDGYILKLYHDWCPSYWVEYESKVAHALVAKGISTPAATEIVEVNGRRGLVFERVTGISMLQDMNSRQWTIFSHARALAKLQAKINQLSIAGLSSGKDGMAHAIRQAPHLNDDLRARVLKQLEALPSGDKVCHGDFHPGNIMLTDKDAIVIDWMTVSAGNPMADFALTTLLLTIGPKGAGKMLSPLVRLIISLFYQHYSKHYLQFIPDKSNEREKWMPIIAAARLNERIEPEREYLTRLVENGVKEK